MISVWEFEHTIVCPAGRELAWGFWTDVSNWAAVDSSVESVELRGPFAAGSVGLTKPRQSPPVEWRLAEVSEPSSATIEVCAPGATLRFRWGFEEAPGGATRITQRVSLEGERAGEYARAFGDELREGIPAGMRSLCQALAGRAASPAGSGK